LAEGYIKLSKGLLDDPIWKFSKPEQKVVLFTILLMAIPSGQFNTSLRAISEVSGISIQTVRTSLNNLEKSGVLTRKLTRKPTRCKGLTISVNLGIYSDGKNKTNTQTNTITNTQKDQCPYQEIIDLFHENCINLTKVMKLTEERKKHIKSRWEDYKQDMGIFKKLFSMTDDSDFLCGKSKTGFKASFDWLINPNNMVKVLEGNYKNKPKAQQYELPM